MADIDPGALEEAIKLVLQEYGDIVYQATEEGLTVAEKIMIQELKMVSPSGISGEYARSWKGTGKKYKLQRYVGNTKMVDGKQGKIPLSNILEYSSHSHHQGLIKNAFKTSVDKMAAAVISEIKKGV
ncbi:MAG: hypothetical protein PHX14_10035 [Syntrophomonadaceae bacterium]|nr:hypothetical protein [Syntrophomonadaceae bacterium]